MTRRERQGTILQLVREREIATQAELADALRDAGVDVVQTTVSRDVAELGLVKVRAPSGRRIYAVPGAGDPDRLRDLRSALRRWALAVESSANLVVVSTPPGFASPLAQALDDAAHPDVLATVAGENTVLVIAREGVSGTSLRDQLRNHDLQGVA